MIHLEYCFTARQANKKKSTLEVSAQVSDNLLIPSTSLGCLEQTSQVQQCADTLPIQNGAWRKKYNRIPKKKKKKKKKLEQFLAQIIHLTNEKKGCEMNEKMKKRLFMLS